MTTTKMVVASDQHYFLTLLGSLILLAWLVLWAWGQSPYAHFLNHGEVGSSRYGNSTFLLATVIGWIFMVFAMMLPTMLPLITLFRRLIHRREDRGQLLTLLIVGYLSAWAGFGYLAHLGFGFIHQAVRQNFWLFTHIWVIAAGTLLIAGLYQFSSLKYACLEKCRSPLSFITEHWHGYDEHAYSLRLGFIHGLFCIGCCWSLMLLMFIVGMNNLGWMLVLSAVMAIEKNTSWGRLFSTPLGVILIGWSLLVTAVNTGYLKLTGLPPMISAICGQP